MSSSTPRVTMPLPASSMEPTVAPSRVRTRFAGNPLYMVRGLERSGRQKVWAGASTWVRVIPWPFNRKTSAEAVLPMLSGGGSLSPLATMKWRGGLGASGELSYVMGQAQEMEVPSLTNPAAWTRFSVVMRFKVPNWSSLPQRPQLLSVSNQAKIWGLRSTFPCHISLLGLSSFLYLLG